MRPRHLLKRRGWGVAILSAVFVGGIGFITSSFVHAQNHVAASEYTHHHPTAVATPTRITVRRAGLYGIAVPDFSRTIINERVVQELYKKTQLLTTDGLKPGIKTDYGVPPLGWDTGWGVALKITFWRGSHRLVTLIDTGRLPEAVDVQPAYATHLLIGTQGALGPQVNPFLRQLYQAIGSPPATLFNTSATGELFNSDR